MQLSTVFVRFLLSGGFNTAATYALYLVLLQFFPYGVSYTLTFASGIGLAYLLNRYFVFGAPRAGTRILLFPLVYLVQYFAGLLTMFLWVDVFFRHAALAPLASVAITIPITFVLTKWVFHGNPS